MALIPQDEGAGETDGHHMGTSLFLCFLLLALLVRFFTYFPSVIDSDESTYLLIANGILDGQVPYVDNIDIKPVGIFLLFAGILKVFGPSILAVRIAASIAIAITSLFLSKAYYKLFGQKRLAILSGLIYVLAASIHKWGWSANTEVFFCMTTAIGLYLLVSAKRHFQFFFFGIVMGVGFILKYHVLFDFAAMISVLVVFNVKRKPIGKRLYNAVLSGMGFALPYVTWHAVYYWIGHWSELLEAAIVIPGRYAVSESFLEKAGFFAEFYVSFLPVSVFYALAGYLLLKNYKEKPELAGLFIIWLVLVWTGILLTGKSFFHYYFQALLPFAFFTPVAFSDWSWEWTKSLKAVIFRYRYLAILLCVCLVLTLQGLRLCRKDLPRIVANDLEQRWVEDAGLYVEYRNVIYILLDTYPPTKYYHSSTLIYPELAAAYGVNINVELERIFSKKPKFCVLEKHPHPLLDTTLKRHYHLVKTYDDKVYLWERR